MATWLKIIVIIGITFLVSFTLRYFINRFIKNNITLIKGNETNYRFLKNASTFIIMLIGTILVFYLVPELKTVGQTLFAGAGIFAAVLAFASQAAFANIVGGIFIVIFKPFRVGDIVEIKTDVGMVEDITLRHIVIKNFENKRIIIPNSIVSNETITNRTIVDQKFKRLIDFTVSYESDIDKAIEIIKEEAKKHPNTIDNRSEEQLEEGADIIEVKTISWADSGVTIRLFVWAEDSGHSFDLMCDLYYSVKKAFDANNIEIPYPHRTIVTKKTQD